MDALNSLEGCVDSELKDFKKGLFLVKMKEKSPLRPSLVEKHVGGFDLLKLEVTLVGTPADGEKTMSFSARGSGLKMELEDADPVTTKGPQLKAIRNNLTAGKTLFRVSGVLKEVKIEDKKDEKKLVLVLDEAAAVEPKKEK